MREVILIGCTATKAGAPAPARTLYAASDWFTKALAWAEARHPDCGVFVVSAAHELVQLDQVLEPYDFPMSRFGGLRWREAWGERTMARLRAKLGGLAETLIVVLAGRDYTRALHYGLRYEEYKAGATIVCPMQHLGIGQQKHWLKANTNAGGQ